MFNENLTNNNSIYTVHSKYVHKDIKNNKNLKFIEKFNKNKDNC